jgi:cell division protein FtsB
MTSIEKFGIYASIAGIIILTALIIFSKNGLVDFKRLKDKESMIYEQIETTENENRVLENQVKSLKTDLEYIKHLAKHEHDMAEEGELIFKQTSTRKNTNEDKDK